MNKLIEAITAFLVRPFRPNPELVLNEVNSARASLGLPELSRLPAGARRNASSCPLAVALGGFVGVDGICFTESNMASRVAGVWHTGVRQVGASRYVVALPALLQHFVRDFDLGAYGRLAA
ncbi:MAG: hypothetical protein SH809_07870 [Rhodothermales bacterium]|nr:hypothetical protein [Rhodothermales bacterium]